MKKLLLLTLSLFVGLGIAFAFTYEWVIDDMEYANDAAAQAAYVSDTDVVAKATGGTITYDGDYVIHTFLSDGTFTPTSGFNVETLVVAGGGGGGGVSAGNGAGGGAGGLLHDSSYAVTAQAYSITIGAGGAVGGAGTKGTNGSDTTIVPTSGDTITGTGGGGGGTYNLATAQNPSSGGCGGGVGQQDSKSTNTGGVGSQGYDGGIRNVTTAVSGAGGGGNSVVGSNTSGANGEEGGAGGAGTAYTIYDGSSIYYAGGGGGSTHSTGSGIASGGIGGGGNGQYAPTAGTAGTANTGGGGGAAGENNAGGAGGSGIVIIRYLGKPVLQSYSESTVIQQGSYSLKGVAAITDSLNDTLTKTLTGADKLDLTDSEGIEYDIYALRTGSNIKIGIHDSGGTTSEHTANVATSNTNQTESWDISGVADANKDDIDSIIVTISNADAANTFYLDDIKWGIDAAGGGNWTWVQ